MTDSDEVFSDAWLLFSIALAGGDDGASLSRILAAGDYINHAIFTGDELRGGLSRLTARGWVMHDGGRFSLVGQARDLSDSLCSSRRSVSRALKDFEKLIRSVGDDGQPAADYQWLTDDLIHQAYLDYVKPLVKMRRKSTG
jgi:hypothetical protein